MKKILFISFALVLGAEMILRIYFFEQLKTIKKELQYNNDQELGYLPMPNQKRIVFETPGIKNILSTNSHGFYCREFDSLKPPDTYRIALVGSSNESGHFVPGAVNYADLIDERYRKNGQRVEMLNFSIGGRSLDYFRINLVKKKILRYDPDLIILLVGIPFSHKNKARKLYRGFVIDYELENEVSERFAINLVDEILSHRLLIRLYDYSFIVRAVCKKYIDKNLMLSQSRYNKTLEMIRGYRTKRVSARDQVSYFFTVEKSIEILKNSIVY